MTNKWVGWIVSIALLAATMAAGSVSAEYRERFTDPSGSDWITVSGDSEVTSSHGSNGRLLQYMKLEGDGTGGAFARTHVDPERVDTTLLVYELSALIERDPAYGNGNGWLGITFGETGSGFYLAGINDDEIFIADATDTGLTKIFTQPLTQEDWDRVPNIPDQRKDNGVDQRLRYTLQVTGSTASVKINGLDLAIAELPSTASGHFGLATETGTGIHIQEVRYRALDLLPPTVDIYRPLNNTFYLFDMALPDAFTGGPAVVLGPLTVGADVLDPGLGVQHATLYINGQYVPGSRTSETGYETNWTIDTSVLPLGYHELTVRATDGNGNIARETIRFFVLSDNISPGGLGDLEEALDNLLP